MRSERFHGETNMKLGVLFENLRGIIIVNMATTIERVLCFRCWRETS